ncbi:MAG: cobalamin-binding protein [Firmicutes bacterium]|nr:cobalamin-binding protein [Bacillota bacterium]
MKHGREHFFSNVSTALINREVDEVIEIVESALKAGFGVKEILDRLIVPSINQITNMFMEGDFYIPDVIFASRSIEAALYVLKPYRSDQTKSQKAIIGTVEGDIHDIGKNIAAFFIAFSGFDVIDLGVDVSASEFIQAVEVHEPKILGMSAMLTTTMNEMFSIINLLDTRNLRHTVKVIIGGGPVTEEFAHSIGADGYASKPKGIVEMMNQLFPHH